MYDLLFRDVLLLDGTGAPPLRGDLAVRDGRIVGMGRCVGAAATRIDGEGLALMPGIIDGHTHYDAQLTWDPWADPSPALGVTTVVIGNCGFTIAPCRPADRDLTMRNLTQVEGMSLAALREGIRWEFESFPEYLAMLERNGVVPNVVAFAGHSSLRTYVMGAEAATRAATDAEIATMAALLRESIAAGAVGLGSSTNEPHNGEGGVPMPSRLADPREFRALLGAMREAGRGVFMLTKGSTTTVPFLEDLAAETGRRIIVAAMLHSNTAPARVFEEVEAMKAAQRRGNDLVPQVSCCALTMEFTLRSAYVFEDNPTWKQAMRTAPADLPALYADPGFRAGFKRDLAEGVGRRLFNSEWHRLFLREVRAPQHRGLEGRSLADLAAAEALPGAAAERLGGLTVLVNNAVGASGGRDAAVGEMDLAYWEVALRVNLTAPMLLCRAALPHMLAAGHGAIVNVSSRQAERPSPGMAAYCASKGGLNALTRALAVEYGDRNIRANTLSPGYVVNDRRDADMDDARRARYEAMHVTRLGTAQDCAHAAVYLASRESEFLTGINLQLDGGSSIARAAVIG